MSTKRPRTKLDDCTDCILYKEQCNGVNLYDEKISERGARRCLNRKSDMTPDEIDEFMKTGELK